MVVFDSSLSKKEIIVPKKRERDILGIYFDEIGRFPLLTSEQEKTLAKSIAVGQKAKQKLDEFAENVSDKKAKKLEAFIEAGKTAEKKLIEGNLRLVVWVAKRYKHKSLTLTFFGLIQEGNMGLMRAVKKFSLSWDCKFASYAKVAIRRSIEGALRKEKYTLSLDATFKKDEDENLLNNSLVDEKTISPATQAEGNLVQEILKEAISQLKLRSQKIIRLRYGLDNGQCYTIREVAKILGISKGRVHLIEKKSLKQLKCHEKINKLKKT